MSTVTNRFNIHQSQRWFVANTDGVHFRDVLSANSANRNHGWKRPRRDDSPDCHLRRHERRHLVEQSLANLRQAYRRPLSMLYLGERFTRKLHIPTWGRQVWLFRERAKLRKEFEKSGLESHVLVGL
jgi:DNA-directed RNA polymerase specialized sigma24 family protein